MSRQPEIPNNPEKKSSKKSSDSSFRSARSMHVTTWGTEEASSSKDAGKKAMPVEIAQSSREWQNHHIQINQEQGTNEIHPINEEVSISQRAPEHGGEIYQMLDSLIEQYGNDPKRSPEIEKATFKFLEDKVSREKRKYKKTKKLLNYAHEVDSYFSEDRNSYIKEGIRNDILNGISRLYKRKRLPEEMYGWRLKVLQWLEWRISQCVRPNPQEQGHEHQEQQTSE